jgi:putative transposase
MQNGRVESFQGKFRDECLNVSWFRNLWEGREKVETWRREYNQTRPHSSLGYQTPEAFAASSAPPASPPTLAGILKTEENASLSSTNFVSASVRT